MTPVRCDDCGGKYDSEFHDACPICVSVETEPVNDQPEPEE